jgi:hypothetical protein
MNQDQLPGLLHGACHCGAVRLTLPAAPDTATSCNCSLCRRTGGIWAYYALGTVAIEGHPEHTESYVWGDRTLHNFRCRICGIVTHWEPIDPAPGARHGVNLRNFDPALLASVTVRRFDGADTWKFMD